MMARYPRVTLRVGGFKGSPQQLGESTTLQLTTEEVHMAMTRGDHSWGAEAEIRRVLPA